MAAVAHERDHEFVVWVNRGEVALVADLAARMERRERRENRARTVSIREQLAALEPADRREWIRLARDRVARAALVKNAPRVRVRSLERGPVARAEESPHLHPVRSWRLNHHRRGCWCGVCKPSLEGFVEAHDPM